MGPLVLGGACLVASVARDVRTDDTHHEEALDVVVEATGLCPWVDLELPPGVELVEVKGRIRLADGSARKVAGPRLERRTRDASGHGHLRVHTPDLAPGDRVRLSVRRRFDATTWTPDADGFVAGSPFEAPPLPDTPSTATLRQTLLVPGDFQRTLYPGGGSAMASEWTIRSEPSERDAVLVLPLPLDARDVEIDGTHVRRDDSVRLDIPASEGPTEHSVRWVEPDAPTYGLKAHLPGAEVTHTVTVADGRIRWQDDEAWWLSSLGLRQVVPERRDLLRALQSRFQRASIPEPALPAFLRGHPADARLAATLRPTLLDRAGIADLPLDPLFPRRLLQARKSGAVTSVEAALILALQLGQARIPATWAIARPASEGSGYHTSPAGYRVGLVVLQVDGTERWIDPACRVCSPFELPPDLEGADVLSPATDRTPEPREGASTTTDRDGTRAVVLEGPAALALRLALLDVLPADRAGWLATRFGGPGATLSSSEGLAEPGAPIRITVSPGDAPPDPLAPPPDGWWGWLGPRSWIRDIPSPDRHFHEEGVCWTSRAADGTLTETLTIADRAVDPELAARLADARRAPPPEPPDEAPPPGDDAPDHDTSRDP